MATDQGDSRAVLSVGRWAGPGERCESRPALPAGSGGLCWCCRPGHGLRGERPVQTVVTSEGGLEGSGVLSPRALVTFNGVEGTPSPQALLGAPGPGQSLPFPGADWVAVTGAGGPWPRGPAAGGLILSEVEPPACTRCLVLVGASARFAATAIPVCWGPAEAMRGTSRSPGWTWPSTPERRGRD